MAPVPALGGSRSSSLGSGRTLITVILTFLAIIAWIAAMFWFPAVREISGHLLDPVKRLFDAIDRQTTSTVAPLFVVSLLLSPWFAAFAVIVVHELGHLAGGWAAGLKFVSIRFGPIQINAPFRVSFQRRRRTGASGWTHMSPIGKGYLRIRLLIMVFAGPLANLLTAWLILSLDHSNSVFLSWFAFASLVIGASNLVPFRRRSILSDGKRLLMLLRRGGKGERWLAIIQLGADLSNGIQPEDLRPDLLAMATAVRDNSIDTLAGHIFAYASSWYVKPDAETARILEVCLEYAGLAPPMMYEALVADAGVFQARKRKRADLAGEWLADLPQKTQFPGTRPRVEAAILEAQNDFDGSLRKLDEVEAALRTLPAQSRGIALTSLQRWRSELQAKLVPATVP